MSAIFKPSHINADKTDLAGNNGIGRYIFLPGSDGRAKTISQQFENLTVKTHSRGHHLYLGTLAHEGNNIEVAAIASGMGCASMEIILHELFQLGARRFLRVGTAGSLQPDFVKIGDIVNAQASVRDEQTTIDYAPIAVPAIASLDFVSAVNEAASAISLDDSFHMGTVHCKSSLYAREFGHGPNSENNHAYVNWLTRYGVLASEMETAALFIQTQYYHHKRMQERKGRVLCGAILGVVSISDLQTASPHQETILNNNLIELALETIKVLYKKEVKT